MLITNKYARKLVWGIGFAVFCALLTSLYAILSRNEKKVFVTYGGHRKELFSFADFVPFFIMTFLASIRLNVGSDFYNYYVIFNNVQKDVAITRDKIVSQSGYYLLSYIVKQFTDNEYAIFAVIAIMLYAFQFHLMKDEVEERPVAFTCYLFLGFFANSLNILKQCIAMMFVMCFYKMLRQKSFIRCGIYAILAVIFHYSAIFALVIIGVLTIVKLKPSKMLFFISITVGIILALFLPQIINLIIRFVPSASGYATYVNWRRNNQIRLVLGVAGTSLIYIYLIYLIVKNRMQIKQLNETRYLEISFLIIGLCINLASIRIWVVQRIALYFYQFIILIIPALLKTFEPTKRRRVKRVLYFIMFIYLIFSGIFIGENEYYSYNTIFSGDRPMYDADFNRMFQ